MWRRVRDYAVSHSHGLAVDDALTRIADSNTRPVLRLYTYGQCVLLGRFQHLDDEVHVDDCRRLGVAINRRPTGGGSIVMGPQQLGVALIAPPGTFDVHSTSTDFIRRYSSGVVLGLQRFGIRAQFQGKNDLLVSGRKIAGLGSYQAASGARLFHASILVDLDIDFMLTVLKTPLEKMQDKGIASIASRIATVRQSGGEHIAVSEVADAVAAGYAEKFATDFRDSRLSAQEADLAFQLQTEQYDTHQWVSRLETDVRDAVGHFRKNTESGLLDVRAIVAGATVKSVRLHGDFFTSDRAVLDLESSLRWHASAPEVLADTVERSMARHSKSWNGMRCQDVTDAISSAVKAAGAPRPHACFARV